MSNKEEKSIVSKCCGAPKAFYNKNPDGSWNFVCVECGKPFISSIPTKGECNQCKLEGNKGICDRKDCSRYSRSWQETEREKFFKDCWSKLGTEFMAKEILDYWLSRCEEIRKQGYKQGANDGHINGRDTKIIEHCSEPQCPECNKVAYNRGRLDERKSIVEELENIRAKSHNGEDIYSDLVRIINTLTEE